MNLSSSKPSRKQQILQVFANMLAATPGGRITTAALAKQVGVSEAALYRHFPSKASMFTALIEFIETSLFSQIESITHDTQDSGIKHCEQILTQLLAFAQQNPGITRIMTGDAITGEVDDLRLQVAQLFDRLEIQLEQTLSNSCSKQTEPKSPGDPAVSANLILACAEGRLCQFVRSGFKRSPLEGWQQQWQLLTQSMKN